MCRHLWSLMRRRTRTGSRIRCWSSLGTVMSSPRCVCFVERMYVLMLLTDEAQAVKIDWKDESKNLTKLHPRVADPDGDDDLPAEGGSFFNFFEIADDPFDVSYIYSVQASCVWCGD